MLSAAQNQPVNQPPALPAYQRSFASAQNQGIQPPNIQGTVELSGPEGAKLLDTQMGYSALGAGINSAGQILEAFLQHDLLQGQIELMGQYYTTQSHIADKQAEVLGKQEDTKQVAVKTQKEMLQDNNKTQKEITRLNTQRDVAIASIHEKGRNERARIYASSKAFSIEPANRNYGTPQRSLLT